MLRIVLPVGPTAIIAKPTRWLIRGSVTVADVISISAVDIRVSVEVVVVIYVDVIATPAAAITPTATPERPHRYTDPKGKGHSGCVISRRRVVNRWIRIDRRTIDHNRVV